MKLLLDTNIVIPLEPTSEGDLKAQTPTLAELARRAQKARAELFFHPAIRADLARDRDEARRRVRAVLLGKYQELSSPPVATAGLEATLGAPAEGTNDWVDNQLLVAVARDAVDYLVSDDKGVLRKAIRLGLVERVLGSGDAIELVRTWVDEAPASPPALKKCLAHELDEKDPFFDSLAHDYEGQKFYDWLAKSKRAHRDCWVSWDSTGKLEALVLVKHEEESPPPELGQRTKVLKVCTFKVSPQVRGLGMGEQLLKASFGFCYENAYDSLFVTLFDDRQPELRNMLEEFGFERSSMTLANGEAVMVKLLTPTPGAGGLAGHVRFGPRFVDWRQRAYVVPIQPRFCELLFPEQSSQSNLFAKRSASANGLRKAYLCNSKIHAPAAGSVLLFYRSQQDQGVIAIGVVEECCRTASVPELMRFAGRRTVYSEQSIRELSERGPVLAIRFRESRLPRTVILLGDLVGRGILRAAPESIVGRDLTEDAQAWLEQRTLT